VLLSIRYGIIFFIKKMKVFRIMLREDKVGRYANLS